MKIQILYIIVILVTGCSAGESGESKTEKVVTAYSAPFPQELQGISNELIVSHNVDTVFATINAKDPEKWGKYQLQFTTSVSSPIEEIRVIEFGAYLLKDDKWIFKSIHDRPFNSEEFEKWYDSPNAILEVGKIYSDSDNWLAKSNKLDGRIINSLWYFKGVNENGKEVIGVSEVVGKLILK